MTTRTIGGFCIVIFCIRCRFPFVIGRSHYCRRSRQHPGSRKGATR